MIQTKAVGKQKHILRSIIFIRENRAVYEMTWNTCYRRPATDAKIIWRKRFAYWVDKATDMRSEYVILIAFPWLH